ARATSGRPSTGARTPSRPRTAPRRSRSTTPRVILPRAAAAARRSRPASDRDRRLDRRVRVIAQELEVLVAVREQALRPALDREPRQRQRLAAELLVGLTQVVHVQMTIAAGPDQLAGTKVGLLRDHVR